MVSLGDIAFFKQIDFEYRTPQTHGLKSVKVDG